MSEKFDSIISNVKVIQGLVSSIFQFERIEELSRKNYLIAVAYTQLIANVNYCILNMGESRIVIQKSPTGNVEFPNDIEGKLDAVAESFKHMSDELDGILAVSSFTSMMSRVGVLSDIIKNILSVSVGAPVEKEVKK